MMFSTNLQILFCGNARIMENPSGLPQSFGKAFGFPTFHTKPFTIKKGNYNCRQRGIIVDINQSTFKTNYMMSEGVDKLEEIAKKLDSISSNLKSIKEAISENSQDKKNIRNI
jgi:hypothetical protein